MKQTLKDATLGEIADELRRRANRSCDMCGGFGHFHDPGTNPTPDTHCPKCHGTGLIVNVDLAQAAEQLKKAARW